LDQSLAADQYQMSQLFISHSSNDNFDAQAIVDWLRSEGFSEIFFDLDPERGIAAGERWERALNRAALRCEAVLFLVSRNWLASEWCLKEHSIARGKNKALFAALIDAALTIAQLPQTLIGTWQVVDLARGTPTRTFPTRLPGSDDERHVNFSEYGLTRLRNGLKRAGLDPRFFEWPPPDQPNRPPYPGFIALDARDAGVFFGREAPLIEAMDKLRGQALGEPPRVHVLLGASGAGKSSFLRAGLLPRLQRDDRHFLPLPPLRPERAPILGDGGLLGALVRAFPKETRAALRPKVRSESTLRPLLRAHVAEAQARIAVGESAAKPPVLVIAIDQAEELFTAENEAEAMQLLQILAELARVDDPATIVVFGIRSDAYDRLQQSKPFFELPQQTQSLPPLPRGEYARVIEGPAERVNDAGGKLKIDPRLTEALLQDLERDGASDALPLLAFTLEHLWREFVAADELKREDYEATGRIGGVIDRAVERALTAADTNPTIPREAAARESLLRRGFIPWLASVDPETHISRRAIARREDIPEESRQLIDLLIEARLLRSDATEEIAPDGAVRRIPTVEPAHEALLRQWRLLRRWLEEDFALLVTLEGAKRTARDWDENQRDAAWAVHSGTRLKDALGLDSRPDLANLLTPQVRAYLAACSAKERNADQLRRDAEVRSARLAARASQSLTDEGSLDAALRLLLESADLFTDQSAPDELRIAFTKALEKKARVQENTLLNNSQIFEVEDALLIFNQQTKDVFALDRSIEPRLLFYGRPNDHQLLAVKQSFYSGDIIAVRGDLDVERVDLETGTRKSIGRFPKPRQYPGLSYSEVREYWVPEVEFLGNDLIGRSYPFSNGTEHNASCFQVMEATTGRIVEGLIPDFVVISGTSFDSLVLYDKKAERTFSLVQNDGCFTLEDMNLSQSEDGLWRVIPCLADLPEFKRTFILNKIRENGGFLDSKVLCRRLGDLILLKNVVSGSSGEWHVDLLFNLSGETVDVENIQNEFYFVNPTKVNFTWIGISLPATDSWNYSIGTIVKRNAAVKHAGATILNYRHPTRPTHARFIGNDLVVIDGENGRLWAHDLSVLPRRSNTLFSRMSNLFVGTEFGLPTLHHGTGVGRAIPLPEFYLMPDGRKLYCDTASSTRSSSNNEIRVLNGDHSVRVQLTEGTNFITISDNWERMIVTANDWQLSLYTLAEVISNGELMAGLIATLAVERRLTSAMFLGQELDSILVTDYSNRVTAWKYDNAARTWSNREIFRGDYPITYAETDSGGKQLLIIESVSSGDAEIRGSVYSLQTGEKWYDLGSDYKWLGATFLNEVDIGVSKHWRWTNVFPILPYSSLLALAKNEIGQ
jgi:hypothetical protein